MKFNRPGKAETLDEKLIGGLFRGALVADFYCSKLDDEYRLFYTINGGKRHGFLVEENGAFINGKRHCPNENAYIDLRITQYKTVPTYLPHTRVLALKPSGENFEKKFKFAKVVSGPKECIRELRVGPRNERHTYDLKFEDDGKIYTVFEEFIIPTEEYWNNEKDVYGPKESDPQSDTSSESESDSDTEKECEEEETRHHKHNHKKHYHKKHNHKKHDKYHHHHHKHHEKETVYVCNFILVPVFVPMYPQNSVYGGCYNLGFESDI